MANRLSLPHERRKATLRAAKINTRVKMQEQREKLRRINEELSAMSPKKKNEGAI